METLEALDLSIDKWQNIVDGDGEDKGTKNCALCEKFFETCENEGDDQEESGCFGCPVVQVARNNANGCFGTPYFEWCDLHTEHPAVKPRRAETPAQKEKAQEMLDLLYKAREAFLNG